MLGAGRMAYNWDMSEVLKHTNEASKEKSEDLTDVAGIVELVRNGLARANNERDGLAELGPKEGRFEVFRLPEAITKRYEFLTKLPKNVAVMGGMARSIAREIITGDREPIRDIDLVNILGSDGESYNDWKTLDSLAAEYMPDDYAFGHGIQSETLERYFGTRDFTINEALVMNGALVVSSQAYDDLQENIIRPTEYEQPDSRRPASGRLALRALTMQTVLRECTSSYPLIEDMNIDSDYIGSFDVAVQLNKAMSRGAETAERFTELLADYNIIPAELGGKPKATARYLLKYRVYNFEFRANGDKRVSEKQHSSKEGGFYQPGVASTVYHATDPAIQEALEEYDDDIRTERRDGHYTQEEFDEINRQRYEGYEDDSWDDDDEWRDWDEYEDDAYDEDEED